MSLMEIQQEQERQLEQERTEQQQQLEHANKVCLSSAHVQLTLSNHK